MTYSQQTLTNRLSEVNAILDTMPKTTREYFTVKQIAQDLQFSLQVLSLSQRPIVTDVCDYYLDQTSQTDKSHVLNEKNTFDL